MSMNSVCLHGRIGRDLELKTGSSGKSYVQFTLAVERDVPNADGVKETDWIDINAFGKTAEFICQYFKKGQQIIVNGRLTVNSYTAQDGSKRSKTAVNADRVWFCGPKVSVDSAPAPAHAAAPQTAPMSSGQWQEVDDDELPF